VTESQQLNPGEPAENPAAGPEGPPALPRRVAASLQTAAGGPARLRVITLLAAVLALTGADQSVLGAVAPEVKSAIGIGNTQMGMLVAVTGLAAALTILPFGVLADRTRRTRLVLIGVGICVVSASVAGGSGSFAMMLMAMTGLGIGIGAINPAIASLTGDLFPAAARGRIYGYILAGEIGGSAVGLLASSEVGAWNWRAAFWVVALPGAAVAIALARLLPEPARGGPSTLRVGDAEILPAEEVGSSGVGGSEVGGSEVGGEAAADGALAAQGGPAVDGDDGSVDGPETGAPPGPTLPEAIDESPVQPEPSRVLRTDPTERSLWWAVRYVLSIPSNVVLIVSSALGYFFFAGLQTFAVVYLRGRFGVGQSAAGLLLIGIGSGALLGILTTGRLADRLIARHRPAARPVVAGCAFLLAAGLFLPALVTTSLPVAFPLLFLAAAAIGGMNPPIDAARLDIMHPRLWGRAESVRTFLQTALKSAAPVLLGYLSEVLGSTSGSGGGSAAGAAESPAVGQALAEALMLMLVPLAVAGILLLTVGRRCYPVDVATALASDA
jgi:MFS family permease